MKIGRIKKLFLVSVIALITASAQAATEYDLTSPGVVTTVNSAFFMQWTDPESMGSGRINAFVGIQGRGGEAGYNTTGAREFETTPGSKALLLTEIPIATIGGIDYREFRLDINQNLSSQFLSLDKLMIHTADVSNLTGYLTNPAFGAPIYNLDAGGDNYIKLDYGLNPGSGKGDMLLFVPNSAFAGAQAYVYLYSMFGATMNGSDGFEEWSVGVGGSFIPEPATLSLLAIGAAALLRRRKS